MTKKYNYTEKIGRPTEYSDQILLKTREYIDTCGDIVYETRERPKVRDGRVEGTEEYIHKKAKIPTIDGLAVYLKIHKDTIYQWESQEDKKDFSDLISELRQVQADMLINNGLTGDYSPVIAKVLLTKHGYREGTDITTNDKDLAPEPSLLEKTNKAIKSYLNKK